MTLRKGRQTTARGGHGMDIQLRAVQNTAQVFWSANHNSFVTDGEKIISVNGIGEIRWVIGPGELWWANDETKAARDYFFEGEN